MSDPFSVGLDEDPAADFLAREQQELAGLEDDGFGGLASGKKPRTCNCFFFFGSLVQKGV